MTAIANLPDLRPSFLMDFANSGRVDPRIQCTRASAATCFGPDGRRRIVSANTPRIDHDPITGKCLGLLIEESRINFWLNSSVADVAQDFSVTANPYTLSFEGSGDMSITGVAITNTLLGAVQGIRKVLTFTPGAGTLTCTPSGDVRNVQLEAGTFATSYIPTAGSAVLRAMEGCILSGTSFSSNIGPSEGTIFSSYSRHTVSGIGNLIPFMLSDGSARACYELCAN